MTPVSLALVMVAAVLACVAIFEAPRNLAAWGVLFLAGAMVLPEVRT